MLVIFLLLGSFMCTIYMYHNSDSYFCTMDSISTFPLLALLSFLFWKREERLAERGKSSGGKRQAEIGVELWYTL